MLDVDRTRPASFNLHCIDVLDTFGATSSTLHRNSDIGVLFMEIRLNGFLGMERSITPHPYCEL